MGIGVFVLNESLYSSGDDLTLAILAAGEKFWESLWVGIGLGREFCFDAALTHTRLYD